MDDPYTSPDEDPFSSQSLLQHLAYRSVRHRADSCSSYDLVEDDDIPCTNRPFMFFPLTPPRHHSHTRSASASSPPKPRSFLSHFNNSLSSFADTLQPPRPSFSSSTSSLRGFSTSSTSSSNLMSTTTFDTDSAIETPTKSKHSFLNSLRFRNASSPSKHPLSPPRPYTTTLDTDEDSTIDNLDFPPPPSYRFSRTSPSLSSLPPSPTASYFKRDKDRAYFSSLSSRAAKNKNRKKLIISGIGASEFRKLEGVKRWCESFGELRSITRLPNGDLQIDFRDPEVADTVCRVRAKVFIAGVGSVQLSWVAGNKR